MTADVGAKNLMKNRRVMPSALIVATLLLPIIASGCHKSDSEIAEENAIKRHEQEVAARNPASPAARAAWSNYMKTPEYKRIDSAFLFVRSNKLNGQLPGVSRDTKGMFRIEKRPSDVTTEGGCSQEIHFLTTNHPSDNFYFVIARTSTNAPWQFKRAWHVDPSGNVVQEFPAQ